MANEVIRRLLARVRQIREARGLSQESFAERAGLKYKHYQSIEAGRKTDIRVSTLLKLAKACGVELSELFDFETSPMALAEGVDRYDAKTGVGKGVKHTRGNRGHGK